VLILKSFLLKVRPLPKVVVFILNMFKSAEKQIGPRIDESARAPGLCRASLYRAQRVVRPQRAPRLLPVGRPIWPVEFWHVGNFSRHIGYSRGCGASEFKRAPRQAAAAGMHMGPEKRPVAIFEDVEGRARPWIDFDKRVFAVFDKKIDAVETTEPARRRYRFRRAP
jgi:hypothetical protein